MRANRRLLEIVAGMFLAGAALPQETYRVSLNSSGSGLSSESARAVITADGRFVLFTSTASDVVTGDTNGVDDVFLRDLANNTTERVSVGSGGVEANGRSGQQWASADGRLVVFWSEADNLVPGDLNGTNDIFVRDRQLGTTERVNVASNGSEADGPSFSCSISADGRYVSFLSDADNLVSGDTNGYADVFVHDRQTGTTIRVSVDSNGAEANHASNYSSISGDGRYVVFQSWATNLGPTDQNGTFGYDIFVHDCTTGTTEGVSVAPDGSGGDADSESARISDDGRYVVFESMAYNLLPHYGDSRGQILVRDILARTTTAASRNSSGILAVWANHSPSISSDGRYVAFEGDSNDYAQSGNPYALNIYVRDQVLGTVDGASVGPDWIPSDLGAARPTVSADGRFVAFASQSTNLVNGDTNGVADIFLRDRAPASTTSFCFGDGTGSACPCGNSGDPFRGCQNSATTGGAILWATGSSRLGQDTLRITSFGVRATALTVLIQGDASIAPVNYGDGLRCQGGSLKRLYAKTATRGISIAPQGTELSISARSAAMGDPIPAGATRYYQTFYRDPSGSFCPAPPGGTFNVSNAISAVWDP